MGGAWEMLYHCLGEELSNKEKKKYTMALNGRRPINFHATTNQKQVDTVEEIRERRRGYRRARGGCKSIILATIEWLG